MGMSFCHTDGGTRAYRAIFIRSLYRSIADAVQADLSGTCILAFDSISLFPSIIGLLVTSFVADSLGIGNIFIYCGFAIVLTAILMMCIPSVRNLEKEEIRKKK